MLWVGGGATLAVYAILTQPQNTPEEMASVARKAALIGERMFTPLSLLTLAFGSGSWRTHRARGLRILLIARIDVVVLLAVVFVMTAKPFL